MSENSPGQVVTFYSYKGGTGRTMALANVAWILAANGKRVLVADWDLESPGLHRFFHPFIDPRLFTSTGGVIDLIRQYEWATTQPGPRAPGWHLDFARVNRYAFSLDWSFPGGGTIDFLPAGRQNNEYAATLNAMDWDNFHDQLGGGQLLDALRADMKRNYDYTLIDSRTGFSDVADICTIHLPDTLVDCFTYSEQGIDGAAQAARVVSQKYQARHIRVLPVPMRVDPAEKAKADVSRAVAMQRFAGFPSEMTDEERSDYWAAVAVPYQSFYAYEETLATFGDQPGSPRSLLSAYEMLTKHITRGQITALPPMDELLRSRTSSRFLRQVTTVDEEITLRYAPEDQVWAEWIDHVLRSAGVRVNDPHAGEPMDRNGASASARELMIISHANVGENVQVVPPDRAGSQPPLVVYVADVRPLPRFPAATSAAIAGLLAGAAAERIVKLVGGDDASVAVEPRGYGARFPGEETNVFSAPARNVRFTGREEDLLALRTQLQKGGRAAVLPGTVPVALQGMGGIGKTQLAMEYAHRFRRSYDVVWWIISQPATFVDASIADLGIKLGVAPQQTVLETAQVTLRALERGEYGRWLLVYDNAEELDRVGPLMPQSGGHTLITSRNPSWGDRASSIEIEVFRREESKAHLRQRVPKIRMDEADRVAELLGDLPIAVAAAGAWLADTGTKVPSYIQELERFGPGASVEAAWDKTWDLALERLQERSPAAFRLLQLCSVLSSEIALELVYSDEMAEKLTPFDPAVSERLVRGSLVQQINRLSLLKLDAERDQIQVHRVLQHVVSSRMSQEALAEARHHVHAVLAASRPRGDVDNPDTWRRFRILWPHLEASDAVNSTDEGVRQLLIDRVRFLWLVGDMAEGRRLAARINIGWTALLETTTEPRQRDTIRRQLLHMRFNLANILRDQALFVESRELDEATVQEQRELLGANHPHTLMTAGGLAADLRALGRYPDALERDKATYAAWSEYFGDDHPRTLAALNNLASSYRQMGDYRAARERDEVVYTRRGVVLGHTHPNTLASASNLGRDIRESGDYQRSIDLLTSVSATLKEQWGESFRTTLNAQANLAVSLRSAGRSAEAAHLLDTAYERLNETLGPAGQDTLACRLSRAVNLLALGATERATSELEAVRRAYEESLGANHPHTLLCVNNLAAAARATGDSMLALQLARMAADQLGQALGASHPYTLAATVNLAVCTADEGDWALALIPIEESLVQMIEMLGAGHPDTVRCEANLAIVLDKLGRAGPAAEAEAKLKRAQERLAARLGPQHPAVEALRSGRLLHRIVEPHPF